MGWINACVTHLYLFGSLGDLTISGSPWSSTVALSSPSPAATWALAPSGGGGSPWSGADAGLAAPAPLDLLVWGILESPLQWDTHINKLSMTNSLEINVSALTVIIGINWSLFFRTAWEKHESRLCRFYLIMDVIGITSYIKLNS